MGSQDENLYKWSITLICDLGHLYNFSCHLSIGMLHMNFGVDGPSGLDRKIFENGGRRTPTD